MNGNQPNDRLFSLDVLRGLAVFLVLWRHIPVRPDPALGLSEAFVERAQRLGWCGVDLFFVLSGFLISGLLFKEFSRDGRLSVGRFWMRRGFKIWPSYFAAYGLMVALVAAQALYLGDGTTARETLWSVVPNALFVQNFGPSPYRWPNSWSLAVEEHFYLALPLLLVGMAAWGRLRGGKGPAEWFRSLPAFGAGLCLGLLALRLWIKRQGGTWLDLYYPSHARADGLFFGVVLGYLRHYRPDLFGRAARFWPLLLAAVPLALVVPWCYPLTDYGLTQTFGFTFLYLAFGGLVLLAGAHPGFGRRGPAGLGLVTRGLAWLGVYSYTIYLAHSVVYKLPGATEVRGLCRSLVEGIGPLAPVWADRVLFFALSLGGAVLLSHLVERPFLRWRERWFPGSSRRPARADQAGVAQPVAATC